MISALSGSTSAQLLSLFARPQANGPATQTPAAQRPSQSSGLPPGGRGASAQSVFDALLHKDSSRPASGAANASPLEDVLAGLVKMLDTNGDGNLSADEMKSAVDVLQGVGDVQGQALSESDPATTATRTSTASGSAKSLSESLFNAMAGMTGGKDDTNRLNALSQKVLTMLMA